MDNKEYQDTIKNKHHLMLELLKGLTVSQALLVIDIVGEDLKGSAIVQSKSDQFPDSI